MGEGEASDGTSWAPTEKTEPERGSGGRRSANPCSDGRVAGGDRNPPPATWKPVGEQAALQVGVAGAEHGVETGHLQLPATAFAGLLVMAVTADLAEDPFTIHLLLEAPKRLLHGLTFFEFNLGHADSLPFEDPGLAKRRGTRRGLHPLRSKKRTARLRAREVQCQRPGMVSCGQSASG